MAKAKKKTAKKTPEKTVKKKAPKKKAAKKEAMKKPVVSAARINKMARQIKAMLKPDDYVPFMLAVDGFRNLREDFNAFYHECEKLAEHYDAVESRMDAIELYPHVSDQRKDELEAMLLIITNAMNEQSDLLLRNTPITEAGEKAYLSFFELLRAGKGGDLTPLLPDLQRHNTLMETMLPRLRAMSKATDERIAALQREMNRELN